MLSCRLICNSSTYIHVLLAKIAILVAAISSNLIGIIMHVVYQQPFV